MNSSITVKLVFLKSHNSETWSIFAVGEWPTFGIKLVAFLKILPHFDCVHTIYTNYSALAHNFNNTVRGWSWKSSFCCWTEFQNFHLSWPGGPWGSLCTSASCSHSRWRRALWPGKKEVIRSSKVSQRQECVFLPSGGWGGRRRTWSKCSRRRSRRQPPRRSKCCTLRTQPLSPVKRG